jgi:hypothetical protein
MRCTAIGGITARSSGMLIPGRQMNEKAEHGNQIGKRGDVEQE